MVCVHVEVALDVVAPLKPSPYLRIAGRVLPASRQAAVDRLDLVRHLGPRPCLAGVARGSAKLIAQRRIAAEPLELSGQRQHVTQREKEPPLSLADQLAIELQVRDDRDG